MPRVHFTNNNDRDIMWWNFFFLLGLPIPMEKIFNLLQPDGCAS